MVLINFLYWKHLLSLHILLGMSSIFYFFEILWFHRGNLQVVKAVQGRVPVFLDGGVRRGTDVFKALALGASGIFVSEEMSNHILTSSLTGYIYWPAYLYFLI